MNGFAAAFARADAGVCCAVLAGVLLAGTALWMLLRHRRRLSPRRRVRLAMHQDTNGRRLLQMARELDAHASELRMIGVPAQQARRWAGQCRTLAAAHLACINALLLDPRVTREIIQGMDAAPSDDDCRRT